MKHVGIVGMGEVGRAIQKLTRQHYKVFTKDLDHDTLTDEKIDLLHICIPYSSIFVEHVSTIIDQVSPACTLINSTIIPGTTRKVFKRTHTPIAHTPIMGVHPNLAKYQKVFTKVIGPINQTAWNIAKQHWQKLGAPQIICFDSPEETELAKLLSTTYYGWNIMFNKEVKKLCNTAGCNFDHVYTKFNTIYNQGYAKTKPNVIRPVLDYVPGPIGGHCIISNAQLLEKELPNPITKAILSSNRKQLDGKNNRDQKSTSKQV